MFALGKECITILAILFITVIEMSFAFGTTLCVDMILFKGDYSGIKTMSTGLLLLKAGMFLGLLMVIVHYGRQILRLIPFPLNGVYGFKYHSMPEWILLEAFIVFCIFYSDGLTHLIDELRKREVQNVKKLLRI